MAVEADCGEVAGLGKSQPSAVCAEAWTSGARGHGVERRQRDRATTSFFTRLRLIRKRFLAQCVHRGSTRRASRSPPLVDAARLSDRSSAARASTKASTRLRRRPPRRFSELVQVLRPSPRAMSGAIEGVCRGQRLYAFLRRGWFAENRRRGRARRAGPPC